eukprot:2280368-Prymnesium_polylepis.1
MWGGVGGGRGKTCAPSSRSHLFRLQPRQKCLRQVALTHCGSRRRRANHKAIKWRRRGYDRACVSPACGRTRWCGSRASGRTGSA